MALSVGRQQRGRRSGLLLLRWLAPGAGGLLNNTESFGLVQVEAFLCGPPVVATDLPGVRQPVRMTGMGEIVPIADAAGLAEGIVKVLKDRAGYVRPRAEIVDIFSMARTTEAYERLFGDKCRVREI